MNRRYYRSGFSLIELLIVVAIIAALVGVAVPMFQKNIADSRITKAKQDIDTIKQQVTLHDSQERPLTGTSLDPLKGRYLQEIPKDPWGNDYLIDANVGVIISWGADQKAGGLDEDADIIVRYKAPLQIQKVQYSGSWGIPKPGAYLKVTWTKPFDIKSVSSLLNGLTLILDTTRSSEYVSFGSAQGSVTATGAEQLTSVPTWANSFAIDDPTAPSKNAPVHTDKMNGILVLFIDSTAAAGSASGGSVHISSSMAVNFSPKLAGSPHVTDTTGAVDVLSEVATPGGPLDPKGPYGTDVPPVAGAFAIPAVGSEDRGCPIERIAGAQ